jgi:hypothetical protein
MSIESTTIQFVPGTTFSGDPDSESRMRCNCKVGDDHIEFSFQEYADDVVLISQEAEGIEAMMRTLEEFIKWSRMEINGTKSATISYFLDNE